MTQEAPPATQPLSSYFAKVHVTDSQAISLFNSMVESHQDRDPTLVKAFNDAIEGIQSGTVAEAKEEDERPHVVNPGSRRSS